MPAPATRTQGEVSARRHNLSLVLRLLADDGPRSRAGIAGTTGLTKATISKLVEDLEARGLVHDIGTIRGTSGRPATMVAVSPSAVAAIGIVIDGDEVRVGAVDLSGALHHQATRTFSTPRPEPPEVARVIGSAARSVLRRLERDGRHPVGLTVGIPGLVAGDDVVVAPNLGWQQVPLGALVHHALQGGGYDGDIGLDNEANLAARAEARVRAERSFILVSAGVGIGAGVVADGVLFRGAHGFGGELGHFVVEPHGRRCGCGNHGCLETIAGQRSLMRACGHRLGTGSTPTHWHERIVAGARAGAPRVLAALEGVAAALATALASAVSLFDPEAIVLGGYLTELTPWVAPRVEAQLQRRVLGSRYVGYPVRPSAVGPSASVLGAGWSGLAAVLADPLLVPPRVAG